MAVKSKSSSQDIAIIGIGCRFPGANNYEIFWDNLAKGIDSIKEITPDRWDVDKYYSKDINDPNKTVSKWCGLIYDFDKFDNQFFNISPREASQMDPQQRLLLEETRHCMEDSGVSLVELQKAQTAVYIGVMAVDKLSQEEDVSQTDVYSAIGSYSGLLANRISYALKLTGDSHSLDAACASSLVAIHKAKQALLANQTDYVFAGAVNLNFHPFKYISFSKSRMLSPDGRCKTFDKDANGYVPGDGVAVLLLQRLDEAVKAKNHIYGVIKGSAVNYARSNLTITSPKVESQYDVITQAYKDANIKPDNSITYIEAHGTGTSLGDPIEVEALNNVFNEHTNKKGFCKLGSVKTNIGHTEAAAGMAGVIKVLMMMKHKKIASNLNFNTLNPVINLDDSAFTLALELSDWKSKDPLLAGVSSFGMGGVNSHLVLEEYKTKTKTKKSEKQAYPFLFSAKTKESLIGLIEDWKSFVKTKEFKNYCLYDISATLNTTRESFAYRFGCSAENHQELSNILSAVPFNFIKKNTPTICLRIGEYMWRGWADIGPFLKNNMCFSLEFDLILELLKKFDNSKALIKDFQNDIWSEKNSRVFRFIAGYVYLKSFYDARGFTPKLIAGVTTSSGLWIAFTLAGLISCEDALAFLMDQKKVSDIEFFRPNIPFFDSVSQKIIQPFYFTKDYLQQLLNNLKITKEIKDYFMKRANLLLKNQFTFKKYIEQWNLVLAQIGNTIEQIIENKDNIGHQKDIELFVVIVCSCSYKLNQKWNLSSRRKDYSDEFKELIFLINDNVMPKDTLIDLFRSEKPDFQIAADVLNKNQNNIDSKKPYGLIRKQTLSELGNITKWIEKSKNLVVFPPENMLCLDFGRMNTLDSDRVEIFVDVNADPELIQKNLMIKLWLKGATIYFDEIYPKGSFCKVPLPVYHFNGKKFNLLLKKEKTELSSTKQINQVSRVNKGVVFYKPVWKQSLDLNKTKDLIDYKKHVIVLLDPEDTLKNLDKSKLKDAQLIILKSKEKEIDTKFSDYALQLFSIIKDLFSTKVYGSTLFQVVFSKKEKDSFLNYFSSLAGLLKTARIENPNFITQLIELDLKIEENLIEVLIDVLEENSRYFQDVNIKYENNIRFVEAFEEIKNLDDEQKNFFKDNSVYLITGGAGGLGKIFARQIANTTKDTVLILSGRSEISDEKTKFIDELKSFGANAFYKKTDVTNNIDVKVLIKDIHKKFGKLSGIIHCAGINRDNFIIKKSDVEFKKVLAPKVTGVKNLDELTKDIELDFFILFSSFVGTMGNIGQADYACANAFMDAYAADRNSLLKSKNRSPNTFSINWPLWQDGNMQVDEHTKAAMTKKMGMIPIETNFAISALYKQVAAKISQLIVLFGDVPFLKQYMAEKQVTNVITKKESKSIDPKILKEKVLYNLKMLFVEVLGVELKDVDTNDSFESFGLDSVMITQLNKILDDVFCDMSKTLFYEYNTLSELADFFILQYKDSCASWCELDDQKIASNRFEYTNDTDQTAKKYFEKNLNTEYIENDTISNETIENETRSNEPIAIIGLSGRYPQAKNTALFWENLKAAKDCITEIPESRWKLDGFYNPDPDEAVIQQKSYSKWGGFVDGFCQFDPLFFNISPKEALNMDPQERIFLQTCWEVIEDAGYTKESLKKEYNGRVGVFAGITKTGFELYKPNLIKHGSQIFPHTSFSSIANRVSYLLDLKSSSMPIDTMCSSSLTAIHEACEHIYSNDCEMAIAGGVNLYLHPLCYVELCAKRMLTVDRTLKSFGKGGDGFVPGEGVGAVLLKRLSRAIKDNDNIYAIIRGTGINHGGRTSGYTVPNPNAQGDLIRNVMDKAKVNARQISYIEAHGTGTALGDPIEITGLTNAFKKDTQDKMFCFIGSAKSNIGHLEAAAGIAGLTKILMQMQHKKIAPSINAKELNPNINFSQTPFVVQQKLSEWKRPEIDFNGSKKEIPRIAGLSSFGAGGANAHIIIEEYICKTRSINMTQKKSLSDQYLFVLSAKNEQRLKEYAKRLIEFFEYSDFFQTELNLADICYTYQLGREEMDVRLAVIINTIDELKDKLQHFIADEDDLKEFYLANVKRKKDTLAEFEAEFEDDDDFIEIKEKWIKHKKYSQIASLWVKGMVFDWNQLYDEIIPNHISLPTYPFSKDSYWIPNVNDLLTFCETKIHASANNFSKQKNISELMTFEEFWDVQELSINKKVDVKVLVCFSTKPEHRKVLTNAVEKFSNETKLVFIYQENIYKKQTKNYYSVSKTEPATYKKVFVDIISDYNTIDAVFYMSCVEDTESITDYSGIIYIIQALASFNLGSVRFLMPANFSKDIFSCYGESMIGFERSLGLVMPELQFGVIYRDNKTSFDDWTKILFKELCADKIKSVRYSNDKRYICNIRKTKLENKKSFIQAQKTYLITGGCGGLGALVALYFAEKAPVKLILVGRSSLIDNKVNNKAEKKRLLLNQLESLGSQVIYIQADVCDYDSMKKGLTEAYEKFGKIFGVIHAAGVESKKSILKKDLISFNKVLRPKIEGTLVLDKLFNDYQPEFICYFSSSSAILGDFGSCDYAVANRFLISYAAYKNKLSKKEKNIVICWPLWRKGGMGLDSDESAQMYLKSSGQRFLETKEGLKLFDDLLSQKNTQHLVLAGEPQQIKRFLNISDSKDISTAQHSAIPIITGKSRRAEIKGFSLKECLAWDLKEHIHNLLNISHDQLDSQVNLAEFGFDSVTLSQLATALTQFYEIKITPSIFFENFTIKKLIEYFLKKYQKVVEKFYEEPDLNNAEVKSVTMHKVTLEPVIEKKPRFFSNIKTQSQTEPIAIIGMSGRFPETRNIRQMWQLLENGKEAVTKIPLERFDWRKYWQKTDNNSEKITSNRCGILPGVSEFEPLFFEISPKEARSMDPRQRLLLQEAWRSLEDAGYGPNQIKKNKMGIFVGVESTDYSMLINDEKGLTSNHEGILASRLAYFLNFRGPAMAINTACSSGLVAAHEACLNLRAQECDTAIAAGVNLLLTPLPLLIMSKAGMLSPSGRCFAFDKRADGLVPGEAVVSVVLKKLSDAKRDNDLIYGVITGSGINYDGKTNGITAPNGEAQVELLKSIYDRYQINPKNIDYIVTHGTGTKLGDPVEVNALNSVFKDYTDKKDYCALTSTKTNFGHTGAASGLVSLVSLLQAFKNEKIPKSLHCEEQNDYIDWKDSPFYVNKATKKWEKSKGNNRIGAVSSFGMSGTNAHMVIESYDEYENKDKNKYENKDEIKSQTSSDFFYLLTLSAKRKDSLKEKIVDLLEYLQRENIKNCDLSQISLTLAENRHHFNYRNAIVIQDIDDAIHVLNLLKNNEKSPKIFSGEVLRDFTGQTAIQKYIKDLLKQASDNRLDKNKYRETLFALAELYCQGYEVSLKQLYYYNANIEKFSGLRLPTYPFAREKYLRFDAMTQDFGLTGQLNKDKSNLSDSSADFGSKMLAPVWDSVLLSEADINPAASEPIVIVGGTNEQIEAIKKIYLKTSILNIKPSDSVTKISDELNKIGTIKHIIWIWPFKQMSSCLKDSMLATQQDSIRSFFRTVKALIEKGFDEKTLTWTLITTQSQAVYKNDYIDPVYAGIHGFAGSMAKEYLNWKVRVVDLASNFNSGSDFPVTEILRVPFDYRGRIFVRRYGKWLKQKLITMQCPKPLQSLYRHQGVYLVIGGAGNIGFAWTKYMIEVYDAQIIWIGRREINHKIQSKIDSLAAIGKAPLYISCDTSDKNVLEQAVKKIKNKFLQINGVIQSALTYSELRIKDIDEQEFFSLISSKIELSFRLAQIFSKEKLDFLLFFSSIVSFKKDAGQSHYSYGSTFIDAFAQRLSFELSCVVKVLNWGYWNFDTIDNDFKQRLAKIGTGLIEPPEAMEAMEKFLSFPLNQMVFMKITDSFGLQSIEADESMLIYQNEIEHIPLTKICKDLTAQRSLELKELIEYNADVRWKEFDETIVRLLWATMQTLGCFSKDNQNNAQIKKQAGIVDLYDRWFDDMLNLFVQNGYLEYEKNAYKSKEILYEKPEEYDKAWENWQNKKQAWDKDPGMKPMAVLLETTLGSLVNILLGKKTATDVMFPNSSLELVEGIYKSKLTDFFNYVVGDTISTYIKQRKEKNSKTKISILEIGAGTGGTSEIIFKSLTPYRNNIEQYCYTDLSKAFLLHAKKEYHKDNPYLNYKIFNIEKSAWDQGLDLGGYDIVVATNVLHATHNIRRTIRNAKAVIKKNGLILLNELAAKSLFLQLTFGLLEGWWLYEDPELRINGCPGLTPESWKKVLEEEGFLNVMFPAKDGHILGQQVVAAESNGIVRQKRALKPVKTTQTFSTSLKSTKTNIGSSLKDYITTVVIEKLSEVLEIDSTMINAEEPFSDYGIDSILGVNFVAQINETLSLKLETTIIFDYATVDKLTSYILDEYSKSVEASFVNNLAESTNEMSLDNDQKAIGADSIKDYVEKVVMEKLSCVLEVDINMINSEEPFSDYGIDSILGVNFVSQINEILSLKLETTIIFDYSTVEKLTSHIVSEYNQIIEKIFINNLSQENSLAKEAVSAQSDFVYEEKKQTLKHIDSCSNTGFLQAESITDAVVSDSDSVAVIGISGQFPGATDTSIFWNNLMSGYDAVQELPLQYLDREKYFSTKKEPGKTYCKWGGILSTRDYFDPLFFNISPREAESMSYNQRLVLVESWKALEDAGYAPHKLSETNTGMFIGAEPSRYFYESFTGSSDAIVGSRLSYFLNLNGPALIVNTGCSSSGSALHLACESIRSKESTMALAGGVFASLDQSVLIMLSKIDMLSPSGKCHTFDEAGDGTVLSEGVGIVLLKSLKEAVHDNDNIYGVIKGSGLNQDGTSNGITAPSGKAQEKLITNVYNRFNINPEDISYIEAHGTGTKLGDPIEANALKRAFKKFTNKKQYCAIGSSKSYIGHTLSAAGVIGLIKILLSMRHRKIPGLLNFNKLNSFIDFNDSAFYVNKKTSTWNSQDGKPLTAALNSFGHSGTNAHIVVQEYVKEEGKESGQWSVGSRQKKENILAGLAPVHNSYIVPLSAKNSEGLKRYAKNLLSFIETDGFSDNKNNNLQNMAFTLQIGRDAMPKRAAFIVQTVKELVVSLDGFLKGSKNIKGFIHGEVDAKNKKISLFESDEEVNDTILKWISKNKLEKIAELWALGFAIDWNLMHKNANPQRISLPGYPFDNKRYGNFEFRNIVPEITSRLSDSDIIDKNLEPLVQKQEPSQLMTFEEFFRKQELSKDLNINIKTLVCISTQIENRETVNSVLKKLAPETNVIFIHQGSTYKKNSPNDYSVSKSDKSTYELSFNDIISKYGSIDALLYLPAIEDVNEASNYASIIYIIQAMAALKLKSVRFLAAACFLQDISRCYAQSWIGFERSLGLVAPNIQFAILFGEEKTSFNDWLATLWQELHAVKIESVRFINDKRHVYCYRQTNFDDCNCAIESGKTYLITGGCGGIGALVARYFAKSKKVNLILTGRSPLDNKKQSILDFIKNAGSRAIYIQEDVCDYESMEKGLVEAKKIFGKINGVIHSAGIIGTKNILEKDYKDFKKVLQPKIEGTLVLDKLLCNENLDFVCYFSSASAILGDFGLCDYSVANRFLNSFADFKNTAFKNNLGKKTKYISINWPLWKDGGMGFESDDSAQMYLKSSGLRFLENDEALKLLDCLLSQKNKQHLVLAGEPLRIKQFLGLSKKESLATGPLLQQSRSSASVVAAGKGRRKEMAGYTLSECLQTDLKSHMSSLLKISKNQLNSDTNLSEFGFDSISLSEFSSVLTKFYEIDVTPSIFFANSTIKKLVLYFLKNHKKVLEDFYKEPDIESEIEPDIKPNVDPILDQTLQKHEYVEKIVSNVKPKVFAKNVKEIWDEPIAIIGMSGRFPGSRNIGQMWKLLAEEKEAIDKIPLERFNWQKYYNNKEEIFEKITSNRCGILPGMSEFEPLFFEISPKEALSMDPRQRLLLQEAYKALEDAGYGPKQIKKNKLGIFVGVESADASIFTNDEHGITSTHEGILASRLAYFLNFEGPAMAINTACSSGLVAAHQACMSLMAQECDTAIAGGVNLILSPVPLVAMSKAGMLSVSGKCFAFDKRADGLVPGEAVVSLVFKRLSDAKRDKDSIYAVIKGSGINYDGKSNGITAPNGDAQTRLLKSVYDRNKINPEKIDYIVTHGTGTKLGDPIEINALYDTFKNYTDKRSYCALTSTKTNLGHTFAASGLVSLVSLVLAIGNNIIPASLNCKEENDYINWKKSPFYVNKTSKVWEKNENGKRIGAVSAFGMSGTNAHMVVESYDADKNQENQNQEKQIQLNLPADPFYLLTLSAKNNDALKNKIEDMLYFLKDENLKSKDLAQISLILADGRHHFNYRNAIVVKNVDDAICELNALKNNEKSPKTFVGLVPNDFTPQITIQKYVDDLLKQMMDFRSDKTKYRTTIAAIAELYCQGYAVSIGALYDIEKNSKLRLPTYPFAKEKYWSFDTKNKVSEGRTQMSEGGSDALKMHPLLHQYASDWSEQHLFSIFKNENSSKPIDKNKAKKRQIK